MTLVIIVGIALVLFGLAFGTKRRFGVLGLGLAAGVLLAQNAFGPVAEFFKDYVVPVGPLSYDTAAIVFLTLLPALLLLIGGPKYASKKAAILGSVAFALLGTLLILGPLTTELPTLEPAVKSTLDVIAQYQSVIVASAIIAAVIDTIMQHGSKSGSKHSKY